MQLIEYNHTLAENVHYQMIIIKKTNKHDCIAIFIVWVWLISILLLFFSCFASMEICDPRHNITMCPLCDHACSYWKLVTACGTARASHLFDNPATVFFSIFMALWGVDAFVFISQKSP